MELYFFRHGEAEPASAGGTDDARELTARGRQESRSMAEALLRAGLRPEAIYTSPLVRARQTGQILGEVFGLSPQADERLRCGATFGDVQALAAARGLARIMFVGHEPDLSTIGHQLTGGRVKMRTSCCARVEADRMEPGLGILVWLLAPDAFPQSEASH
ncbi:MAG: phosphohistidine phosphatase SixA [Armatimonadetes bacterium]|nr:phosphohistidine phosphatase SixA [Armatimonadota bacterium]